MSRPSLTVIQGGGKAAAANESLSGLAGFIQEQASHYGFAAQDAEALHAQINASEALRGLDQQSLRTAIVNAFEQVKADKVKGATELEHAKKAVVGVEDVIKARTSVASQEGVIRANRPDMMTKLKEQVAANEAKVTANGVKKGKSWIEKTNSAEKLIAVVWLGSAGLSFLGAGKAAANSSTFDEKGNKTTNWSQVSVVIAQAAIGACCTAAGVQTLRGKMRF